MRWYLSYASADLLGLGADVKEVDDHVNATQTILLLVTVFTPGQATSNYQVAFGSQKACDIARLQVIKDIERVRQENLDRALRSGVGEYAAGLLAATASPSVSAVCAAQ
jgi:hypothetical protein